MPVFALTASPGAAAIAAIIASAPTSAEGERDQQLDRDADEARALGVVGHRPQRAAVARVLEEPRRAERERDREPDHEEGASLHLRPAEVHEARRARCGETGSGSGKT